MDEPSSPAHIQHVPDAFNTRHSPPAIALNVPKPAGAWILSASRMANRIGPPGVGRSEERSANTSDDQPSRIETVRACCQRGMRERLRSHTGTMTRSRLDCCHLGYCGSAMSERGEGTSAARTRHGRRDADKTGSTCVSRRRSAEGTTVTSHVSCYACVLPPRCTATRPVATAAILNARSAGTRGTTEGRA